MNDDTRAHLVAWRGEIQASVAEARAGLETATSKLRHAEQIEAAEKARVADIRATVAALGPDRPLASVIAARLDQAVKPPPGVPNVRSAQIELETAQRHFDDVQDALAQIDLLLSPPAPRFEPDPAPVSAKTTEFDPIVPARAAA